MENIAREREQHARQVRVASEAAVIGVGATLLVSAALPMTDQSERVGLVTAAAFLFIFAGLWFHVLPERVFGSRRFLAGNILVQIISWFLLFVTGGLDSRFFVYFLVPILASSFSLHTRTTLTVGGVAVGSYLTLVFLDPDFSLVDARDVTLLRFFSLLAVTLVASLISRTMERTRESVHQRTTELGEQNQQLEAARTIALRLSRLRERDEIISAIHEAARRAIGAERAWLFLDPEKDFTESYTVGPDGTIEHFSVDITLRDPARLRAVREMQSVVIADTTGDPGVSERSRELYAVRSVIIVPLVYRSKAIGVVAFSCSTPRHWSALEVRLAETIADGSTASVATHLALDELRDEQERLARRTRVLEGLAYLSESLGLTTDDATSASTAARNLQHTFELRAATVLFFDQSLALLEPRASAGEPSAHPVVAGPLGCPAIRSGRLFRVESAEAPVPCPHVAFAEGTTGFVCLPFVAAGQTVGAMFLEPTAASILDEALLRGAADRVALTIANQRVLETAQRQAVTDGLTGLYNRHFMVEQLHLLHSLATRHGRPYSAIAIDVDRLKTVNDTFGHEKGDFALRGLASALRSTLRASDVPVRTGGDEFVILLPDTNLIDAARVAERIRFAIEEQGKHEPASAITVSLGVATWRSARDAQDVIEAADTALYQAKRAGRDRISVEKHTTRT
jgi:diguanylate cyclase (GGDEF)-like protein